MFRRAAVPMMSRACLLAGMAWSSPGAAAEASPATAAEVRADQQFTTYAYAHEFGSGIYDFNGRTLQVYTLPFSWTAQEPEGRVVGWHLQLPVTLGFLDFKTSDVISTGLPDSVDSVAFVPGIRFSLKAGEHWTLLPYAQAGASVADQSEVETRLFGAGLRAERSLPTEPFEGHFAGELIYSGVRYRGDLPNDDFIRFRNGVSLDRATGREWSGHSLRLGFFSYVDVYLDPPTGPTTGIDVPRVQFESGLLLNTRPSLKVLRMPLPRIGLSYRFAGDLSGLRFVIGAPF
jgi:hypothetical protein